MGSRHDRRDAGAATGHGGGFTAALGLPDDARAMTLEQLDRLITYHDVVSTRFEEVFAQLLTVRDQIEVAMREYGRDVLTDPERTEVAPLRGAWTEAVAEYSWCSREIEAIAAYVKPLSGEEG
jgi:hypothetical protein